MAGMRPPLPEGQRPPLAAGIPAVMRRAAGAGPPPDHMWEVLHAREQSGSPRAAGQAAAGQRRAVSEAPAAGGRPGREGGSPSPSPPAHAYQGGHRGDEWTPRAQLPRQLPKVNWEVPNAAFPNPPDLHYNNGYDIKGGGLLKNDLRHQVLGMQAASADAQSWLERRLVSSEADQRADLARRWSTFEQADRRFKEWVQREHEEMTGQLQQVKVSSMDGGQQQQRHSSQMATQVQRLELRLQEVEGTVAQADAKANGLAHAVQVSGAVAGSAGSNAASAVQGEVESIRMDLQREASARASASHEATEKIKELHGLITHVNERQEHEAYSRQNQLAEHSSQGQARVAALEPNFEALRGELDALRQQLQRTGGDCARRCEEVESNCLQKVAGVREAASSAARELWEEHSGVLAECKASMASLQQILETKDKIAAQLQNLTQQQLQDDKEGLLQRLLQGDDALRGRLTDLEAALVAEQGARVEAQHGSGTQAGRMGAALEQAQAAWVKESDRINGQLSEMKRQADRAVDGSARDNERRLAEAVDALHRRVDNVEGKASSKPGLGTIEDRLAELARTQEASLTEVKARVKQQIDDLHAMQAGKLSQCDFELRSAFRAAVQETTERARAELTRVEEGAAIERGLLTTSMEDLRRENEVRVANLREGFEQRFTKAEDESARRAVQANEMSTQLRRALTEYHNEARSYSDRVGQEARANADVNLASFMEEIARKEAKNDRTVSDIAREIASTEARLSDAISVVEAKSSKSFQDGLKLEREHLQNEVETLLTEERSIRMQAEAERLASLQKRLAAHEGLTTRCLDNLKTRQDDAFAAHRQSIEALLVQDGKEISSKIEEIVRDHRAAAASTKAEVQRLDGAREKLQADSAQAVDDLAASTEVGRAKLEDQMQRELASFSAKMTVCMTTCATQLRHGQKAADERLADGLAGLSEKISSGLAATAAAADTADKALQEVLEASIAGLGSGLAAHALESAAARASIRTDLANASSNMDQKLSDLAAASQAFDSDLERRVKSLEGEAVDLAKALEAQGADLTSSLAKASDEAREAAEKSQQGLRDVREEAEKSHAVTGERFQQVADEIKAQEASIATAKQRLDEQESQLAASRTEAEATLTAAKEELSAKIEAATRAQEDKLMGQISAEQEQRLALGKRLGELDGALKEGEERTRAAEVELNQRLDDLKKWSEGGFEEVKGLVEALRTEHDGALGAELTRATTAEAELEEKCRALVKEQVESSQNEQSERIAEVTKRLESQEAEVQKQLQEQDHKQQKQSEDFKAEVQSQIDATAADTESSRQAVEDQKMIHDDGIVELKEVYEKLKAAQQKSVEDEEARASAAEEVLAEKLQVHEASLLASEESLQSQLKSQEEKQLIREGKLQEHYTQLVEASQAESSKEMEKERAKADEAADLRLRSVTDQQKNDKEMLQGRLEKAEGLIEYRYAEQKGINDEAFAKDAQLSARAKVAEESSAKAASSAEESEAVAKLRGDVNAIKESTEAFQGGQTKTNEEQAKKNETYDQLNKDRDTAASGFEEQLGAMVLSCADIMGRVDSMAKKEDVKKLKARVEGGFKALVVQMESERWLKANTDSVADGIGQAFMSLVDQTSEKLSVRVQKIENALSDSGAA